jgi:hypothetical protein
MSHDGRVELRDLCVALDIDPGALADVFRHESARILRALADDLDGGQVIDDGLMLVAAHLSRVDELEVTWGAMRPEESVEGGVG